MEIAVRSGRVSKGGKLLDGWDDVRKDNTQDRKLRETCLRDGDAVNQTGTTVMVDKNHSYWEVVASCK